MTDRATGGTMTTTRKMLGIAASAMLLAVSLTGCMRVESDLYINSDAQVNKLGATVAMNKEVMSVLDPENPPTLENFKTQMSQQAEQESSVLEQACTFTENDTEFIATCTFAPGDPGFDNAAQQAGADVQLVKDGSTITATVTTEDVTQDAAGAQAMGLQTSLNLHFPAAVESVTGAGGSISGTDPNTAVIDMLATDGQPVIITADSGSTAFPVGIIVAGGLGVLLVGLLAALAVKSTSGKRKAAPAATEAPSPLNDSNS